MHPPRLITCCALVLLVGYVGMNLFGSDMWRGDEPSPAKAEEPATDNQQRVPLEVARDRAKVMHDLYQATLDVMHERYFHGDRAVVPARAMEDMFTRLQQQTGSEAKWISASLEPMSVNHKPKTEFEIRAAKEIAAGKSAIDEVEAGYYRRATAIPLTSACVNCHQGFFRNSSTAQKFAGLVISLPIDR